MVQTLDELTDFEKLSLVNVSYSRLETYDMCAAKYFYTYIARYPRVFGPHATLGNIIHSTLENVLEPDTPVDGDLLLEEYEKQKVAWDPENQIPDNLYNNGEAMINEFADRHAGDTFPIDTKEKEFAIVVGGGLVRGFIDRVDIKDDVLTIIDYKSGAREVTHANTPTNLQLGIYALAMSHEYPDKTIKAELYYLKSGRVKGHTFSKQDLIDVEDRLLKAIHGVMSTETFHYTKNIGVCSFCDYRKTGQCPYGVKMYKGREY